MSKFFIYKLTVDNGGAPCVTPDLLTLAICKPAVRSVASLGNWVFGFGDNKGLGNRVIYIAEITGKLVNGAYYAVRAFRSRHDCIYGWKKGALLPIASSPFHGSAKDALKDIGPHPEYGRANVLLSTNFRYFGGATCTVPIPVDVKDFVRQITQGHRNEDSLLSLKRKVKEFRYHVWEAYPDKMVLGRPSHANKSAKCYEGEHVSC
jgi:hypothetical protein